HFETVDVMRVRNGKITDHWGVANLFSLMQQLGLAPALGDKKTEALHEPPQTASSSGR
ncbi:MAG: ester cyclase, partial [Terriglobales bacterium]